MSRSPEEEPVKKKARAPLKKRILAIPPQQQQQPEAQSSFPQHAQPPLPLPTEPSDDFSQHPELAPQCQQLHIHVNKKSKKRQKGAAVLELLPVSILDLFGTRGFAVRKGKHAPAKIVNPFHVSKAEREEWKQVFCMMRDSGQSLEDLPFLVHWFGRQTYALVPQEDFIPLSAAPPKLRHYASAGREKLQQNLELTKAEARKLREMDDMMADIEAERISAANSVVAYHNVSLFSCPALAAPKQPLRPLTAETNNQISSCGPPLIKSKPPRPQTVVQSSIPVLKSPPEQKLSGSKSVCSENNYDVMLKKRPRGRPPLGKIWDPVEGCYISQEGEFHVPSSPSSVVKIKTLDNDTPAATVVFLKHSPSFRVVTEEEPEVLTVPLQPPAGPTATAHDSPALPPVKCRPLALQPLHASTATAREQLMSPEKSRPSTPKILKPLTQLAVEPPPSSASSEPKPNSSSSAVDPKSETKKSKQKSKSNVAQYSPEQLERMKRLLEVAKRDAKQLLEREKSQIERLLPETVTSKFGRVGFAKWGKVYLPALVLNPYQVPPGEARDMWINLFHEIKSNHRALHKISLLVFWYGELEPQNFYSLVPNGAFVPYDEATEKMLDYSKKAEYKRAAQRQLTADDKQRIRAMQELREDLAKRPEDRRRGNWNFLERHELLSLDDMDDITMDSDDEHELECDSFDNEGDELVDSDDDTNVRKSPKRSRASAEGYSSLEDSEDDLNDEKSHLSFSSEDESEMEERRPQKTHKQGRAGLLSEAAAAWQPSTANMSR